MRNISDLREMLERHILRYQNAFRRLAQSEKADNDIPDNWRDDPLEDTPPVHRDRPGKP